MAPPSTSTTVAPDFYLPPDVAGTLDALTSTLRAASGDSLLGLILYGGLARGRYNPGTSDINIVVYVRALTAKLLAGLAKPLHDAWESKRVDPMIVAKGELPRLSIAFPTKILDIQRKHVVLFGEDPFAGIVVSREHIRAHAEQELRHLSLRLRRRFISAYDDNAAIAMVATDAAVTLAVNLRELLFLRGVVSDEFQPTLAIYERAAETFGLDLPLLSALKHAHRNEAAEPLTVEQFDRLLATVAKASDIAAEMDR
jgi:predicted nucleotidyltransferase